MEITIDQPAVLDDVELFFRNSDSDLVADVFDVCPFRTTLFQEDGDGDLAGGVCDNCPLFFNPRQEDNDGTGGGDVCDPDDDDDALADLSDGDMDGDLVFNVEDNCPAAWNPDQQDDDANSVGNACDPDDGLIEYVEARAKIGFKWRRESNVLGYRVYRQRLSRLSNVNLGVCVQDAAGDNNFLVTGDPEPGEGFAYVVTAEMPAGEGMLGRRGDGVERPNLRPCD